MNIKQLRYFCEVVEAGNANLAAQKLFVAPTAISMQISQLEDHLGGKLFDRRSRPMALTSLGAFFYPKARTLLSDTALLETEAKGIAAGKLGWLSIGFVRSTFFSVLSCSKTRWSPPCRRIIRWHGASRYARKNSTPCPSSAFPKTRSAGSPSARWITCATKGRNP